MNKIRRKRLQRIPKKNESVVLGEEDNYKLSKYFVREVTNNYFENLWRPIDMHIFDA